MVNKKAFTLLETLVAIALLLLASGAVGWKMNGAIQKKRFSADIDRLQSRLQVCQRLAVATQSDWKGTLRKVGSGWVLETASLDSSKAKVLAPLKLHSFTLTVDGKKMDRFEIDFFSSGQVLPSGNLRFEGPHASPRQCPLPEIFQREANSKNRKLGPLHPDEK